MFEIFVEKKRGILPWVFAKKTKLVDLPEGEVVDYRFGDHEINIELEKCGALNITSSGSPVIVELGRDFLGYHASERPQGEFWLGWDRPEIRTARGRVRIAAVGDTNSRLFLTNNESRFPTFYTQKEADDILKKVLIGEVNKGRRREHVMRKMISIADPHIEA